MQNKKGRVIVTSSRNIMALVIARSLGSKGIDVIGADCISQTMLSNSKYVEHHETYRSYEEDEAGFLEDLKSIIKKYKPSDDRPYILMPVFKETTIVSREADKFKDDITLAIPEFKSINHLHPKNNFAETAKRLEVNTPVTLLPDNIDDLSISKDELKFPLIIKPYDDSGGKGIEKLENWEELTDAFNESLEKYNSPPLVQELCEGEDYCLGVLFKDGQMKAAMAYKNIARIPSDGGSGVVRETVDETPFIDGAKKLLTPLGWNGVAQLDFMWNGDVDSEPKMIEVNTRFWAGLFHSVTAGVDFPWLVYRLFSGEDIKEVQRPDNHVNTKLPVVWLGALIDEAINIDKTLKDFGSVVKSAGKELKETKNPYSALQKFLNLSKTNVEPPFDRKTFNSKFREARNAENEILNQEDPTAVKGIAYSLSYWAKYGKLPPEVNL